MSPLPTSDADPQRRPLFYGRRKGKKLHNARQQAYETVLPEVKINLPLDHKSLFSLPVKSVRMEIGFGNGEHLLQQALDNPDVGFIGCEPFINGIAALCIGVEQHNLKNIRIFPDDARILMAQLPLHSLEKIYILNSDPWPKKKHHKRRFIQTETLDAIKSLLIPGGHLIMSTDHPSLAAWLIEKTYFHPGFEWTAKSAADWQTRPADMRDTRYQQKGLTQGRPTVFFDFMT